MSNNIITKNLELLAPAGNMEKLFTALHFGCDAVYLAGKNYGLRASTDNFDNLQMQEAAKILHQKRKKLYVTLNIFAFNSDFLFLKEYLQFLSEIGVDGVIVSDLGIIEQIRTFAPNLKIHLSTQANVTNKYSAKFYSQFADRIVLSRELSIDQIKEIHEFLPDLELEAFVHGAMCISFSGRCLISDYLTGRRSNHGECVQSCRWEYALKELSREGELGIEEDNRGTYILNSRDLNMIEHLDSLVDAGVSVFKIEGRVKSSYYVGGAVNAYRRAIDLLQSGKIVTEEIKESLNKISNREYCTGFYFGKPQQNYVSSKPSEEYRFVATVLEKCEGGYIIEQRNRFSKGDTLNILSCGTSDNADFVVCSLTDEQGNEVSDAKIVKQKLIIYTIVPLFAGDMLRKKSI